MKESFDGAIGRRRFLRGVAAAAPVAYLSPGQLAAFDSDKPQNDRAGPLIVRQKEPENLEMPFRELNSFITPTDRFYVRNHFPIPKIDVQSWRLRVEGAVEKPLELSYAELTRLPVHTQVALLHVPETAGRFFNQEREACSGNFGAVGNGGMDRRAVVGHPGESGGYERSRRSKSSSKEQTG